MRVAVRVLHSCAFIIFVPCISNTTGAVNCSDDSSIINAIHSIVVPLLSRRVPIDNIVVTPFGVTTLAVETLEKAAIFSGIPFTLQVITSASGC